MAGFDLLIFRKRKATLFGLPNQVIRCFELLFVLSYLIKLLNEFSLIKVVRCDRGE